MELLTGAINLTSQEHVLLLYSEPISPLVHPAQYCPPATGKDTSSKRHFLSPLLLIRSPNSYVQPQQGRCGGRQQFASACDLVVLRGGPPRSRPS